MKTAIIPTKSVRTFPVSVWGDHRKANAEASLYARQFTSAAGLHYSYNSPRLFVTFDHEAKAYYVEPNWDFMPHNLAWKLLCETEDEE
jgi:hypothetical protein